MAKSKPEDKKNIPVVKDRSWFYTDLGFMPKDEKESRLFCAQMLFYMKRNSNVLVEPQKAFKYRENDLLNINQREYKQILDPRTPGGTGGNADYIASDFNSLPIAVHLDNILKAKLQKISLVDRIQVNEINKFSRSQRQKDKDKIIHKEAFRELITIIAKDLGLPPLSRTETAEEYISKLEGKEGGKATDEMTRVMEQIKLQIKDDQDYALYEQYVYKGEIERAFELGIQHFLINKNKWKNVSQLFIQDVINFNKYSGMCYTDDTTGDPVVRYLDPSRLFTSPFKLKDGEDIMYWFYEEQVTFGDFIRMVGNTMTDEQLKEVFMLNKYRGGTHTMDWGSTSVQQRNNAMIMLGFACVLTQDSDRFAEEYVNNPEPTWKKKPLTWEPEEDSAKVKQKIYNVWHSFYYVPPPGEYQSRNRMADWVWQSQYIFKIEKITDMYRYGVDRRFAKSPLVIWKSDSPSVSDIKEAMLPKIYTLWHKFQNAIVQDTNGVAIDEDFFLGILNAADEGNQIDPTNPNNPSGNNGVNAGLEAWRQLRQSGMAMLKFRDKNGNPIPGLKPSDFFVPYDTKHLDKAEKYLQLILQQYEILKVMLAQSDVTEGQTGKPRTTVAAIQAAVESSNNAQWFVEYPVRECLITFGERIVQHILYLVKDKTIYNYEKRWNNFEEVVGLANALLVEGVADLLSEDIGLSLDLVDTQQMQEYIFSLANEMAKQNQVAWDAVGLVTNMAQFNYKYAYAVLMLSAKQKAEENAAMQDYQFQQQMELEQKRLETAMALQNAKNQGAQNVVQAKGQVDAALQQQMNEMKYQTQLALKNQTTENRIKEDRAKKEHEVDFETQKPIV